MAYLVDAAANRHRKKIAELRSKIKTRIYITYPEIEFLLQAYDEIIASVRGHQFPNDDRLRLCWERAKKTGRMEVLATDARHVQEDRELAAMGLSHSQDG